MMTFGAAQVFLLGGASPGLASACALGLGGLLLWWIWRRDPLAGWQPRPQLRNAWLTFVLGAVLLTGCFFAGLNFGYRWVFGVWLVPLLWSASADSAGPRVLGRLAQAGMALLLVLLWLDGIVSVFLWHYGATIGLEQAARWADRVCLLEQPFVWAFFGVLQVFLLHFTRGAVSRLLAARSAA
jgi:hypothetical protein